MEARLNEIVRKGGSKSPKDGRPVRPLSAYNIFFHMEKKARMDNESDYTKGNFSSYVSARWKKCSAALKLELEAMSKLDKERYHRENLEWKENMLKEALESTEGARAVKSHSFNNGADDTAVEAVASANKSTLTSRVNASVSFPALPFQINRVPPDTTSPALYGAQPFHGYRSLFSNNSLLMVDVMEVDQPNMPPTITPFQTRPNLQANFTCYDVYDTTMDRDDEPQAAPGDNEEFQSIGGSIQGYKVGADLNPTLFTDPSSMGFKAVNHSPSGMFTPLMSSAGVHSGVDFQSNSSTSRSGIDDYPLGVDDKPRAKSGRSEELEYMRGYMQGYKAWTELNPSLYTDQDGNTFKSDKYYEQVQNGDRADPSFKSGYNDGFKAASEMWSH